MERNTMVIKKYENRRLYDSTNSRYINLEEVAQAIRSGADVQVLDAATGEDITRIVLTQIIVEDAKAPNSPFSLDILRQMVMATGRAGQESALKYMKAMFDMYQNAYRVLTPAVSPFDFVNNLTGGAMRPAAPPAETAAPREAASEVEDLKRRLAELEALVTKRKPRSPAARKTRKPTSKLK